MKMGSVPIFHYHFSLECAALMPPIISVSNLSKTYASGFEALKRVNLDIRRGEIFGLLGPNGAGKTTLINIVCGIVTPSAGTVSVGGHDILKDYRAARAMIGLVPQELTSNAFESVWATVRSEEHTSELQSQSNLVCRLLLEKKKNYRT